MLRNNVFSPEQPATMAIGPFCQRHMQCPVVIIIVAKNRGDAFGLPNCGLIRPLTRRASIEDVCLTDALAKSSISREGIHHVPNYGVFNAVPDEQYGESPEQLADKPTCPPLGQVRCAEIRAREYEGTAIRVSIVDQPMEVDHGIPNPQFGNWEVRGRLNGCTWSRGELESPVKVGGDEAADSIPCSSEGEQCFVGGKRRAHIQMQRLDHRPADERGG